jgi:hypothetical protein
MGKQSLLPPEQRPRPRRPPTPELLAKAVVDKCPRPPGQPDKAEITLRLVLLRAVREGPARAIREDPRLEDVVAEARGPEGCPPTSTRKAG